MSITRARDGAGLTARPSTTSDHEFLLALFAKSRPELTLLPDDVRPHLVRMQFDSQLAQYSRDSPAAVDWILEVGHDGTTEPVGRCYLDRDAKEHRILDLAIEPSWRGQGIASRWLAGLCDDARSAGVPLRLTVWHANSDARRLYERLGFRADNDADAAGSVAQLGGYVPLCWRAEA